MMQSLPYELLQHVASSLLPRYQCRLALASKHHYNYLYNDLLRWHTKWRQVAPPKYYLHNTGELSIKVVNSFLIGIVRRRGGAADIAIYNITKRAYTAIHIARAGMNKIKHILSGTSNHEFIFACVAIYGIEVFDGFYTNMDSETFAYFASIRISPLLSLPSNMLYTLLIKYNIKFELKSVMHLYIDRLYWDGPPTIRTSPTHCQ